MSKLIENTTNAMPGLSHLRCEQCATRQELNDGDAGRYFSEGWPTHCGYTMNLITKAEEEKEKPLADLENTNE